MRHPGCFLLQFEYAFTAPSTPGMGIPRGPQGCSRIKGFGLARGGHRVPGLQVALVGIAPTHPEYRAEGTWTTCLVPAELSPKNL